MARYLKDFFQVRKHLTVQGSIVLYNERIVVPASLSSEVLDVLHSSHGGVSSMVARSSKSLWWPGMQDKIDTRQVVCRSCDVAAPSQPAAPSSPLPSPSYPFEMVCSDFFCYGGHKYLIIVDRFSNWISVYKITQGGANTLVKLLRRHLPVTEVQNIQHQPHRSSSHSGVCITGCLVLITPTATRGPRWG